MQSLRTPYNNLIDYMLDAYYGVVGSCCTEIQEWERQKIACVLYVCLSVFFFAEVNIDRTVDNPKSESRPRKVLNKVGNC